MSGSPYSAIISVTLRYWMSKGGNREIEFFVERDGAVAPVEVKASRGSTVSLDDLLDRDDVHEG